jgi:hypothetical protein
MTVYGLAATRIITTLDDLEKQVLDRLSTGPGVDVSQLQAGDVVRLLGGALAELIEIRNDGALVLEHRGSHLRAGAGGEIRNVVIEGREPK